MQKFTSRIFLIICFISSTAYISGIAIQLFIQTNNWSTISNSNSKFFKILFDPIDVLKALLTVKGILCWVAISSFILVGLYFLKLQLGVGRTDDRGITYSDKGTLGTAGWMNEETRDYVFEVEKITEAEGTILGKLSPNNDPKRPKNYKKFNKNVKVVALPQETYYNKHKAIFGSSGSKKSRAYVRNKILQDAKMGISMILTDPKGELARDMAPILRNEFGYNVKIFNLVNPTHSDRWNVLNEIRNELDAQIFADVVIENTNGSKKSGDQFWERGEQNLLKALALYVVTELPSERQNMGELYKLLASGDSDKIDKCFEKLPNNHPARLPYNIYCQAEPKVKTGIVMGLGTRLQVFQSITIQHMMAVSDIDLEAPGKEKCAYFAILSDTFGAFNFLATLFFSFLFIRLVGYADSMEGVCNPEVDFILDEFPNIGQIPDFKMKISTIRSRGLNCDIIFQNISQLKDRYPNDSWQEIIGNCDTKLFLGCTDTLTAQFVSEIIGEATIESTSHSKDLGIEAVFDFGKETTTPKNRYLLKKEEVLKFPSHEALVIIRGQDPLKVQKMDYMEHPLSKKINPSSLMLYNPEWVSKIPKNTSLESNRLNSAIEQSFQIKPEAKDKSIEPQKVIGNDKKNMEAKKPLTQQVKKTGFKNYQVSKSQSHEQKDYLAVLDSNDDEKPRESIVSELELSQITDMKKSNFFK